MQTNTTSTCARVWCKNNICPKQMRKRNVWMHADTNARIFWNQLYLDYSIFMRFRRSEEKSGNKIEGKPTCCCYAGFETMNKFDLDWKKIDLFVRIYKILKLNVCTFPAYWNHDALGKIPYYCDIFQKELVFIFIKLFWPRKKISTGTILWFSNLIHWHVWMKVRLAFILINMLLDKSKWKKNAIYPEGY